MRVQVCTRRLQLSHCCSTAGSLTSSSSSSPTTLTSPQLTSAPHTCVVMTHSTHHTLVLMVLLAGSVDCADCLHVCSNAVTRLLLLLMCNMHAYEVTTQTTSHTYTCMLMRAFSMRCCCCWLLCMAVGVCRLGAAHRLLHRRAVTCVAHYRCCWPYPPPRRIFICAEVC